MMSRIPLVVGLNNTSSKNFILDVGMEKEEKQELGWRVSL